MSTLSHRLPLVLAALSALGACAGGGHGHSGPNVALGAPRPAASMDWTFTPQGSNAALTYGPANGPARLMMACTQNSGTVTVGQPIAGEPKQPLRLVLLSGTVKSSGAAQIQASPANPDVQVVAETFSTLDPIIQAFDRNGWISVPGEGDKVENFTPKKGNTSVHDFVAFCG